MKLYNLAEESCIVAEEPKGKKYIVKDGKDFYQLNEKEMDEMIGQDSLIYQREIRESRCITFIMIGVIVITTMLYLMTGLYTVIDRNFLGATFVLLINIPIHELGHILCLKLFYPKANVSVGFKFVFIYPAFYVDTSDSYLLPKYKRIAVYLCGNFNNCVFLLISYLFFPKLLPYCYLVITNILINFIPIIKSDGYYAFAAFRNKFTFARSFIHTNVEDFIRGLIMFVFLEAVSILF